MKIFFFFPSIYSIHGLKIISSDSKKSMEKSTEKKKNFISQTLYCRGFVLFFKGFLTMLSKKWDLVGKNIVVKKRLQETCQIFWNKELNEKKIDGTHNETSNDIHAYTCSGTHSRAHKIFVIRTFLVQWLLR